MRSNAVYSKKIILSYILNYLKHFLDHAIYKYFNVRNGKSIAERNIKCESVDIPASAGTYNFPYKSLSCREMDVLACVIGRCSNKETANLLDISYKTVEAHIH
ncbi:MAG: LuxR C-terminal-related transcriptional regulator, partial [Holosporales bacterium]|nr:LuxR C-terminal-related transcriptional regulator [Holosporales bacterium]